MPTGACGINCDMCKLRLMGICSTCGSGKSPEAEKKLAAQRRAFGGTCTILECAVLNRVEYCLRDCRGFPCENFSKNDLKSAHHFAGPHELNMTPLLERYGNDPAGFRQAAAHHLGGTPEDMADLSFRLLPFPRIPVYYLYWKPDEEFGTRIKVLFDRSIEELLTASGIWALVWRVNIELLRA